MAKWGEIKCPRCGSQAGKAVEAIGNHWDGRAEKDRRSAPARIKHWEGERKYALCIIVHLKNTPGSDAEGSCAPQADGSGEDS
jgi:hypothetical protein